MREGTQLLGTQKREEKINQSQSKKSRKRKREASRKKERGNWGFSSAASQKEGAG